MIRVAIVLIFVVTFLVCSIPLMGLTWLYGKYINQEKADIFSLRLIQLVFKGILFLSGTKVIVKGSENVPEGRAVVYIGDHRSIFDVIIGYSLCPWLTSFVAKDSLEKVPLLVTWMRRLHCQFLNRDDTRSGINMIKQAVNDLENGISVYIFPEGTRSRTGEMLPFKAGTFKIATKAKAPIVPVAFSNTSAIFEDQFPKIRRTTVVIHFGEPIETDGMSREDQKVLHERVQRIVEEMLEGDRGLY